MKLIYTLFAFSLALVSNAALAQEVSLDDAKTRALDFLSNQSIGPKQAKGQVASADLSLAYTSKSEQKTCFYVFNIGNDNGFVIAGGDEAAHEILGYCDHGKFDYDTAPENFKWWLSQYTEQIAHADASAVAKAPLRAKVASEGRVSIGPLIQTKWGQHEPYNCEIPVYNSYGEPYVTGCVATAMAQVMYYHKCPATNGVGNYAYTNDGFEFSADFENTTYDWDNMLLNYSSKGKYTDTQLNAIGTLMYHAGVSVGMDYGIGSSGAFHERIGYALANYFKFDKSLKLESRYKYSDSVWEDLVYNELAELRPVVYCGFDSDETSGHEFICDGYDSDKAMFTFNWGWSGSYDGCYPLSGTDALKSFVDNQMIYLNIMKDKGGEEFFNLGLSLLYGVYDNYHYYCIENYENSHSSKENMCYVNASICNKCVSTTNFDLGLKAIDLSTGKVHYWTTNTNVYIEPYMSTMNSNKTIKMNFNVNELEYNGYYELYTVGRKHGLTSIDDWVVFGSYNELNTLTIRVTGAKDPDPINVTFSTKNDTVQALRTLQIKHNPNYEGNITYESSDNSIATVDTNGLIEGVSVGDVTITAKATSNKYFKETTASLKIHVIETIKDDVAFELTNQKLLIGQNSTLRWTYNYDGGLTFGSSDPSIATVDNEGKVTGISSGCCTIIADASGSDLFNYTHYEILVNVIGSFEFTEEPYFNNDNNPYEDDMILYYKIKNSTTEVSDINMGYFVCQGYATYKASTNKYKSVAVNQVLDLQYDFKSLSDDLAPNESYTIEFFQDGYLIPFNYPIITFTYRNKLTVDYSISSTGYGTLILPFNQKLPEGMKVYSCPKVENNVIKLVEESSIKRNNPYIVTGTPGASYQFVGPEAIDDDKHYFQEGVLVGVVGNDVPLISGTDYILQEHNGNVAFYKYTGTKSDDASENDSDGNRLAKQFRAFLRLDKANNAPKLNLPGFLEDGTDGIEAVNTDRNLSSGIYSIDGKRQTELQKGLNVLILEDGTAQKVFVK